MKWIDGERTTRQAGRHLSVPLRIRVRLLRAVPPAAQGRAQVGLVAQQKHAGIGHGCSGTLWATLTLSRVLDPLVRPAAAFDLSAESRSPRGRDDRMDLGRRWLPEAGRFRLSTACVQRALDLAMDRQEGLGGLTQDRRGTSAWQTSAHRVHPSSRPIHTRGTKPSTTSPSPPLRKSGL